MTLVNQFAVDVREHERRRNQRSRKRRNSAIIGLQRISEWTPAEDAIVLRWDLLLVEKVAMLQRSGESINTRLYRLRTPLLICPVCSRKFHPHSKKSKVCSKECGDRGRRSRPVIPCSNCGAIFKRPKKESKFCSLDCYITAHESPYHDKICRHCGVDFRTKRPKPKQLYCSNACSARAQSGTHCKRGHEFTPENTYVSPRGNRACRQCTKIRDRSKGIPVGIKAEIRAARLARWAELGKTYEAVAVLAAEAGVKVGAIKRWLLIHGDPAPSGNLAKRKTHCINGHAFTPENTSNSGGRRSCKSCNRNKAADRRALKRKNPPATGVQVEHEVTK